MLITELVAGFGDLCRPARVLSCLRLPAGESRARLAGLDPVSAHGAVFGDPDVFEDAAAALDRLRRGDVAGLADDQHPVQAEHPRLAEHPAQRPNGQPAPALVALLRAHLKAYGTTPDGRLFRTARGRPLRLRAVPDWSPALLDTRLRTSKWFL
jgi:hypothetical protein